MNAYLLKSTTNTKLSLICDKQGNLLLSPRSSRRLSNSETLDSVFLGGIGEYENGFLAAVMSLVSWPFTFATVGSKVEVTPAVDCKSAKSASKTIINAKSDEIIIRAS